MYDLLSLVICQDSSKYFTCNNWLYPNNSLKRQIGSGIDTSGTAQGNIIGPWSLSCYQMLGSSGLYPPICPPLAIHVTYSWPWLCLRPAGHARQSCHLPEVWRILASSSFWISPCASAYLSASAAHLDWWVALGQEKQGLDSQPGMWRTQEELLNRGSASSPSLGCLPKPSSAGVLTALQQGCHHPLLHQLAPESPKGVRRSKRLG